MWTSTLDLKLNRVLLTRLLGLVYPDVYYSSLSPLRVANIPRPVLPSANWVRVRNRLAGICGSDLHLVYADADARISVAAVPNYRHSYPGHEVVGEVIEIGEEVQHLSVGDRVVLQYIPNCLSTGAKPVCRACTSGNYNLCEYGPLPGPQPIGGGWSEEMLLHEQQLFRLPTELSDEQGVMIEPTAVALHAVLRHVPQPDDNILIVGAGTIGLLTLQVLRTLIPQARISISARYPFQIEQATRLGADNIIYSASADPYTSVQRATQSRLYKGLLNNRTLVGGYDVIYDTVGQQKTLHHALRWLRSQGTMVMVGLSLHLMNIDLTPIWHQETNLLGSLSHGIETWPPRASTDPTTRRTTFSIVTELIEQKRLQPEQLITHRFALNNYKDALKAASRKKNNQSVKVLFDYSLLPASAVPNVRASARSHHPVLSQPQGDAFMEEFLKSQHETLPHQDLEPEHVLQANNAQQTMPPKILDTPPPPALTKESWRTILNEQDINQIDADDDDDTATAIPVVKPLPYNPRASSKFTQPPQTPMPIAERPDSDPATIANQASIPTMSQNWQINVRKQPKKQALISAMPKTEIPTDISEQQPGADTTVRFSRPTFNPNDVPVTSLPVEPVPELIAETPEAQLEPQQVEEASNSELPAEVPEAVPSEGVFALPTPDTQSMVETESIAGNNTTQPDNEPASTDTDPGPIILEPVQPTIDQTQKEELTEEEPVIASVNPDEHENLPDFLRYLQPFNSTPTYQQTQPSMIEQHSFPLSTDHAELKLPANDGEASSPFSETANMNALTEEQLPTLNFLDNLFDTDTSSMPAFLEQLPDLGAPIVPEKPIEEAEAPILPDLASLDAPTLPDLASPDASTMPDTSDVTLPDAPTLLNPSAIAPFEAPTSTLLDAPAVTSPTDASELVVASLASRTPKAKKKQKTSKLAEVAKTIHSNVQHDRKQTEEESIQEAQHKQIATLEAQEQAATDTNGKEE